MKRRDFLHLALATGVLSGCSAAGSAISGINTVATADAVQSKTPAQVILRWHLQDAHIAIPGSSNEAHIQENFEIFDFALTDEEIQQIAALEENERLGGW